jgi:23S rRNA pseudouridine2605 synthase
MAMSEETGGERLQKALAAAGVASRRHAEELIAAGRVSVNGVVVTQLGTRVLPSDRLSVDGKTINRAPHHTYVLLNKPAGVLSTALDERGRRTVVDLVRTPERVYPVGRLDLDSEGLVLLTNDGELTFRLLHPRHQIPREYHVWVHPPPTPEQLDQLRRGVKIAGWRTGPAEVTRRPGGALSLVIREGHKRQVRLMAAAVGLQVDRLVRVRLGPLSLGNLKPGEWRELRRDEVERLRQAAGAPAKMPVKEC